MSNVRWWLPPAQRDTEIVLTSSIDRNVPKITFEKWTRDRKWRPKQERSITTPREKDITFDDQDLEEIATQIWIAQSL